MVREEIYRVATRLRLQVFVVSNGSRPIRPPAKSNVSMILVGDNADAADDWIAERIGATDVCVTSDIPLASRVSREERASSLRPDTVDRSKCRQCACRSRNSPPSAGTWADYPWARPNDQAGQVPVSQRTRYRFPGCIARHSTQLSRYPPVIGGS